MTAAIGKVAHGPKDAPRHGFDHVVPGPLTAAKVAALLQKRDKSKPLCLFAGTHHPHVPWSEQATYDPARIEVPPNHLDTRETREQRACYYTDITKADDLLGEIMTLMRKALATTSSSSTRPTTAHNGPSASGTSMTPAFACRSSCPTPASSGPDPGPTPW